MQQDAESTGTIPTVKDRLDIDQSVNGLMETPARNIGSKTKSGGVTQVTKRAENFCSSNRDSHHDLD